MEETGLPAHSLVVTFRLDDNSRAIIAAALGGAADAVYLADLDDAGRAAALRNATVVIARSTKELRPGEGALLEGARLIQFMTAGIDHLALDELPPVVPLASNGGAYAAPMAEHALAMVLAAAKRLFIEQDALRRGEFNQFTANRMLAGATCGILGFGGIGVATARLMAAIGMRVHAINRRGRTDEAGVAWIGAPDRLDEMLAASDVLVISLPLTRTTRGMIGGRELGRMKPDAILVNLARGEIVDEAALYAHLQRAPGFTACIDAWWIEPVRHGVFGMDHPFLQLPNVIGSPHNSASVPDARRFALQRAVGNCRRALAGEAPLHLIGEADRL